MRRILVFYLVVRVILFVTTSANGVFPYGQDGKDWPRSKNGDFRYRVIDDRFADPLGRWDARGYLHIAYFGYDTARHTRSNTAFFPGYPWVVSFVFERVVQPFVPASARDRTSDAGRVVRFHTAHAVSTVFFLLALWLFHGWTTAVFGRDAADRAGFLLVAAPAAFVFDCILSESCYLFLVLAAFRLVEKKMWIPAALTATYAATVRPVGATIILPLVLLHAQGRRKAGRSLGVRWLVLTTVPLGPLIVFLVMAESNGQFAAYLHQQQTYFGHAGFPTLRGFASLIQPPSDDFAAVARTVLQFACVVLAAWGTTIFWRRTRGHKARWAGAAYASIGLVLPLLSGSPISMPRYIMVLFPVFAAFGAALTNPRTFRVVIVLCVISQVVLWVAWVHNQPIVI